MHARIRVSSNLRVNEIINIGTECSLNYQPTNPNPNPNPKLHFTLSHRGQQHDADDQENHQPRTEGKRMKKNAGRHDHRTI